MNFSRPYQEHQKRIAQGLREAKARGEPRYQTTHSAREVDPRGLSDWGIEMIALKEAQRYTERAINLHNSTR